MKRGKRKGETTNLLKVPSPDADDGVVNLADWVEIKALLESDGKASQEDLARAVRVAYSKGEFAARTLAGEVFQELHDRQNSCVPVPGKGGVWQYPFTLNTLGNVLSLRADGSSGQRAGMLYTFLLVASRADMDIQRTLDGLDPTSIFERLCADVLLNFWGGKRTYRAH